jgi:predicted alpha/beta superfamily hydrolase
MSMKPAFRLFSPETKTEYVIYVRRSKPIRKSEPLTAMIFLDGDDQFSTAVKAHADARKTSEMAPLLLVGVGYGASYLKPGNQRIRDYTTSRHADEPTSGGAAPFVDFLRHTLWPELARRYPIREDIRGIGGHSLGSLLALHVLWRHSGFCTHYLASAPSIWWDSRKVLQECRDRHALNPVLPARLFLSVGTKDTESMIEDLAALERQLRSHPFTSLDFEIQRIPGRTHFNVLPDAFRSGLISLFGRA